MQYFAPTSLNDALDMLGREDVAVVAGGTDWFPARGDAPLRGSMLDITGINEFQGISHGEEGWRIGAAASWTDLLRAELPPAFDGLKLAAREVGSIQIQNAATVVGNLCNASPAADGVPPLLTLDAQVELVSRAGTRLLALDAFLSGVRQTARRPDELVRAIVVPDPLPGAHGGFLKLGARRYLVISIAMVGAVVVIGDGRIAEARVAVGACSPVAQRLPGYEAALRGCDVAAIPSPTPEQLSVLSPIDDVRASAAYRADAAAELCRRAVIATCDGARNV